MYGTTSVSKFSVDSKRGSEVVVSVLKSDNNVYGQPSLAINSGGLHVRSRR